MKISSSEELSRRQDNGLLQTPIVLCGDNKGVFTATSAQNPKTPAEPTLTAHVKALREFVDKGLITALSWVDNRDMVADLLTEGKLKRNPLIALLDRGYWLVMSAAEIWPKKHSRHSQQ